MPLVAKFFAKPWYTSEVVSCQAKKALINSIIVA